MQSELIQCKIKFQLEFNFAPRVSFDLKFLIFVPNELIYYRKQGVQSLYIIIGETERNSN